MRKHLEISIAFSLHGTRTAALSYVLAKTHHERIALMRMTQSERWTSGPRNEISLLGIVFGKVVQNCERKVLQKSKKE
jgi:hypothetical protein